MENNNYGNGNVPRDHRPPRPAAYYTLVNQLTELENATGHRLGQTRQALQEAEAEVSRYETTSQEYTQACATRDALRDAEYAAGLDQERAANALYYHSLDYDCTGSGVSVYPHTVPTRRHGVNQVNGRTFTN